MGVDDGSSTQQQGRSNYKHQRMAETDALSCDVHAMPQARAMDIIVVLLNLGLTVLLQP